MKSVAGIQAYLSHLVLRPRLTEGAEAALSVEEHSGYEIFGSPNDMKLAFSKRTGPQDTPSPDRKTR
ncbi:DUF1810 family protein [Trichocoleus sp. FACHB-262]|uniref:DUF1810 family protein n=1 Tax=Trichocoleus sp. FACHB-262 TaxID=2692869 RepID=UPI001683745B|nr:DUF1810 family protein [Trichocoleus sp. FACHB-262]